MTLELRIEELVLHGFAPGDRHAIARAAEQELAMLLADGGGGWSAARDASVLRVDAGSFDVPAAGPPAAVGVEIARAIHRGVGGMRR